MKNQIRKLKAFTLFISIMFIAMTVIAGCGGSSSNDTGTSTPNSQGNSAPPSPESKSTAEKKPEQSDLKVGIPVNAATFLPLYIADHKGFFKEEGLNVQVYAFQGDAGVVQALAGKSIDISVASLTGLVKTIQSGQPFIAFWGGFNQSDFEWYSPKFKSLQETKGATFGITTYGSLTDFLTRYALRKAGLDPEKDVKILQAGDAGARIAAMEAGQLDVSILSTPHKFIAAEKGMHLLISERKDITPTWPQHVIYGTQDFVKNKPETVKAFLRAVVRAVDHIEKNPEDAAKVLASKLKLDEKTAKLAVEDVTPGFDKRGGVDKTGLDFFWEISVEAKDVDSPWPDEKWLDKTYINTQDEWLNKK